MAQLAPCLRLLLLYYSLVLAHQLLPRCAHAGDPDILTDFLLPPGTDPSLINGSFFAHTGLVGGSAGDDAAKLSVSKATAAEFPALQGQSVSYAALVYGPGTVNPPHIHPRHAARLAWPSSHTDSYLQMVVSYRCLCCHGRASELLVVVQGVLSVGLVDAARNGTLYTATLQTGDVFVFPKGMVHFQINNGSGVARAFSAFGSASPGTIPLPSTLFATGIDDAVLEKSFHTDQATVEELKHDELQQVPGPTPAPEPASPSAAAALVGGRSALLGVVVAAFSLLL
ncbi:hypothetical protein U9M48_012819 [Paspalum notatum var. saurae]|uniref:Germin-like protein n=1 Tax=Paspalum notatum var. saurae TaxID=547442 RepID=A0AAQ3SYE3_PASNO